MPQFLKAAERLCTSVHRAGGLPQKLKELLLAHREEVSKQHRCPAQKARAEVVQLLLQLLLWLQRALASQGTLGRPPLGRQAPLAALVLLEICMWSRTFNLKGLTQFRFAV